MKCPINQHEHDLTPLLGLEWEYPTFECSEGGGRWILVPEGTKRSDPEYAWRAGEKSDQK